MTPEERAFAAATAVSNPAAEPTRRRLSPLRILAVLAVIAAAAAAIVGFRTASHRATPGVIESAFMPYVDVTATPQYPFENGRPSAVVLGFVVGSKSDACEPSWGAAYSLQQAASSLDLDRRIARFRQRGGEIVVSFGGAANTELATGCTDPARLAAAYRSVVDRYEATVVDLDLEGDALSAPAVARRTHAMQLLQQQARKAGHQLQVWLTLPVDPSGLTGEGSAALAAMLAGHVRVAGVNGMIMDYGAALPAGASLIGADESALTHLAGQVRSAYARVGREVTAAQSWQLIGATPMIGQNDTTDERFSRDDAHALMDFVAHKHLRRLSMWSLNRDQPCGPNYANVTIVSPNCSGVDQRPGEFADIFARFKVGRPLPADTPSPTTRASGTATSIVDDPATSPYPIWNPELAYAAGTKIVWHRNVYQAKWWTKGDTPDAPVSSTTQTPWTLIGPVLPGEHPKPTPTMPAGTYPDWTAARTYHAGDRVLYRGVGYQAKWYTHGDVPGIVVSDPGQTPWELITSH